MKILYLCADPGIPLYGRKGCSTHIRETCHVLADLGHDVKVICSNTEGDSHGAVPLDVVKIQAPTSRKLGFDGRHILLDRRLRRKTREIVEQWAPDVIYERYSLYSKTGEIIARKFNLPRVLEVNAFLTREQSGRIRIPWLARRVEKGILRKAPYVIVVSEPLRNEISDLGVPIEHIAKMPMAVNLEKFHPSRSGLVIRQRHGLDEKFIIGYVGTLAGWHGLRLLFDVVAEMKTEGAENFAFMVVGGEGEKLEKNRARVREAGLENEMQFVGSVPYDDVPEHIRAMDAAIVPDTTYWSSPAKLFEYQASGVPVLAPLYPAIEEAMDHGVEGLIYEPRDIKKMAAMALQMMGDRDKCRQMGLNARRRAEAEHSWHHNGDKILELYRNLGAKT